MKILGVLIAIGLYGTIIVGLGVLAWSKFTEWKGTNR